MRKVVIISIVVFFLVITQFAGCRIAPQRGKSIHHKKMIDGVYEGRYRHGLNSAVVKVVIKQGKIEKVELVKHFASWKGKKANKIIPQRIVERQSTSVDAVTGATNSSRVIMNAVREAIKKAHISP